MKLSKVFKSLTRDYVDLLMFLTCVGLFIWYISTGINLSAFIILIAFYLIFVMVRFYVYLDQRNRLYQRLKDHGINADDIMFGS
jgi:Flp pilus assembly protein TadB